MRDRSAGHPGIPLPTLVTQLRKSCEASAHLHGGTTYYTEELGIFRAYAKEHGLLTAEQPRELSAPPTAEGNEHQVWYREDSATFLKCYLAGSFWHARRPPSRRRTTGLPNRLSGTLAAS